MLKITIITIAFSIMILLVKNINNEISVLLTIACGIILLGLVLQFIVPIIDFTNKISQTQIIDSAIFNVIFKITAIGYLVEFGASVVEDAGLNSLSEKLVLLGKIVIITTALPVFYAFFNLITEICV